MIEVIEVRLARVLTKANMGKIDHDVELNG